METLAYLVNDHKFAKVSSAKILCSMLNNMKFAKVYFANCVFVANSPKHQSFPLYGSPLCFEIIITYLDTRQVMVHLQLLVATKQREM